MVLIIRLYYQLHIGGKLQYNYFTMLLAITISRNYTVILIYAHNSYELIYNAGKSTN